MYLQLAVYDCTDASELIKVASCVIYKYPTHRLGLQLSAPNYDAERDILRIAVGARYGNKHSYVEVKLKMYVVDSGCSTEIPSFVQVKEHPDLIGTVNAVRTDIDGNVYFMSNQGYRSLMRDPNTGAETWQDYKNYTSLHEHALKGQFMGIHPTCIDPSTEYLLRSSHVIPIKFAGGEIALDPAREIVPG